MTPEPAPKPAILAVDDDPHVRSAIQRDLRRAYGRDYQIVSAESGASALEILSDLGRRGQPVALLLVDQRMPGMDGTDVLDRARLLHPDAKKVLLTAYADTEAAIAAINRVKLDHYLLKPWEPPEEKLYPVLEEMLEQWQESYRPTPDLRVVGHRFSEDSHAVRDFLTRNNVPYEWLDAERDQQAAIEVARSGADPSRLPIVFLPDGSFLQTPTNRELAERLDMHTRAELPFYDLIIVGGGPAGLAAAVYGASEGLRTVLVERDAPGGQAGQSSRIENYLGFPRGLSGSELASRAYSQARRFRAEVLATQEATRLEVNGPARIVHLSDGTALSAHTVLVAAGVSYRRLDVPGVEELTGRGIYYGAALTEASNCAQQEVYVVGGANSAGQAAVYFSRFARRVTMLVRADSLAKSMSHYLIEQIAAIPNIAVRTGAEVVGATGGEHLEELTIRDAQGTAAAPASHLFVFIGAQPRTEWLGDHVRRDERGFVLAGPDAAANGKWPLDRDPYLLETSVPGVFVAGDVRARSIKRVASAVGEGSMAVQFVHQYLASGG
jgi:thioredoxin reductase (NADPH)